MRTRSPHTTSVRHTTLRLVAAVTAIGTAVAAASLTSFSPPAEASSELAPSYGWPVEPFHRQHAIRGSFGDPRILGRSHSFHFGVDVWAPNGTRVYPTVSGRATIHPSHPETVSVETADGRRFGYWHVEPKIRSGQWVTAYQTVIGTVLAPWEHVHLAEQVDGVYVNPLRPGGMGPFDDRTVPTLQSFTVESQGKVQRGRVARGSVDLVVESYDRTPIPIAGPWNGKPLTPALLRWRMVAGDRTVIGWRTAVDFRRTYPSNEVWNQTYARWTKQNKKIWDARYRFYLAHDLETRRLGDGRYRVEVEASDIRGNTGAEAFTLTVANDL